MHVSEIMSTPPVTVRPRATLKSALDVMVELGIGCLPVVDDEGCLVAILTEADLLPKEAFGGRRRRRRLEATLGLLDPASMSMFAKADGRLVADVMTRRVVTARPDEEVRAVAERLVERRLTHLPVVDPHLRVVGVVSRRDVLAMSHRPDRDIRGDLVVRYADARWAPEDAVVSVAVEDGMVTLTGSVLHPMDRPLMEAVAWSIPGVVSVDDRLWAREPDPRVAAS